MTLSLQQKIQDPTRGVYLIGTTPPKSSTDDNKLSVIANKLLSRLQGIEYDGLIVYDIQDESSRISAPRPFPFKQTVDPRCYSQLLNQLSDCEVITYKSVAQRSVEEFGQWLDETQNNYELQNIVLVGSPSSTGDIKLSLANACQTLTDRNSALFLGGVTIAERHAKKHNEHQRLLDKTRQGCSVFISQAVYDADATIDLLTSYASECRKQGLKPNRVILTFTPCGSDKTLEFMQWLGISVPQQTQSRILTADNALAESIQICHENLKRILTVCADSGVPLGLNIESLTNRKTEIDASISLYLLLKQTMASYLVKNTLTQPLPVADVTERPVLQEKEQEAVAVLG